MRSFFQKLFTLIVLGLVVIQYQNCSQTTTDGNFWDSNGGGGNGGATAGYAQITTSSALLKKLDSFTEVGGVCNPGLGKTGTLSYEVRTSMGVLLSPLPQFATAKCDSGRFNFIVPKPTDCTMSECRYVLRAQLKIGVTSMDIPEYVFKVSTVQ